MASKTTFRSIVGKLLPRTNTVNGAGAPAYALSAKHALAQYAATGCFNTTFYATAEQQLDKVLELTRAVEPQFVAKAAIFCRERGHMKDMPALLCAALSASNAKLCAATFSRVIDDAKMLRNFVQMMRSGVVGRKSLGTQPKRLVKNWFEARSEEQLFRASVGQSPSLVDVIKMVHPKPSSDARRAFYGYLLDREHAADVSGSMSCPITGHRKGATSKMRCIDGAALVAAAILRKNRGAEVIPFEQKVVSHLRLNPRDSVMTNAQALASIGGGGTNCSAPLSWLNQRKAKGDLVIFVSDNESWVDARRGATAVMNEWQAFKARNPQARLACLDFVPNAATQAVEREDILNIGGFSDAVFDLLASFANGEMQAEHWVGEVERIAI
jgi:hypothetical protein